MFNPPAALANFLRSSPLQAWQRIAFCALALSLAAVPLHAQRGGTPGNGGPRGTGGMQGRPMGGSASAGMPGTSPIYGGDRSAIQPIDPTLMPPIIPNAPLPPAQVVEDEACLPWALSAVRGATVSVIRLGVPSKARNEYNKACGDFKKQKFVDAEEHARNAIQKYSEYVAAWVMLGEVLEGRKEPDQARNACSQAESTDPTYLPAYLCLANLDANQSRWNELLGVTQTAIGLDPVGDVYAYFYRSMALFNLNKLGEAEKAGTIASGLDTSNHQPAVHFLLAQIYAAEGDLASAKAEIRQFLKVNNDRERSDAAKQYLAKLEARQQTER